MYSTGTGTGAHHDLCVLEIYRLEYFRILWMLVAPPCPKLWYVHAGGVIMKIKQRK